MSRQASRKTTPQFHLQKSKISNFINSVQLPLLFVAALCFTLLLASGNVTAEMLFQSPQSPPQQPPPEQQPPAEQPPAEQPPADQPPAEQPPAEQPPAEQPPAEQPPAEQPPAIQPSTMQSPVAQPPAEQPPGQEPLPAEPVQPVGGTDFNYAADEEDPNLVLDEAELIDSVVVSGAYVWLCCGVILFLVVPLSLLLLYIRGRSRITKEEDF
jgi:hypothetical protein